jgi:hypothetical protein
MKRCLDLRLQESSGKHLLSASISEFDPTAELPVGLPVLWTAHECSHHDAVFAIAGRAN